MADDDESKVATTKLVIATRLHLGRAEAPPSSERLAKIIANLESLRVQASSTIAGVHVVVAIDATPKLEGYDYVHAVQEVIQKQRYRKMEVLPVTPWGKFVPALNAIVIHSKNELEADLILFVSAEVSASTTTIDTLCRHVTQDPNVIVAGATLQGHDYQGRPGGIGVVQVPLNGRTTPWNTLAVWDLDKLSRVGFVAVSDLGPSAGVEECAAIAVLQKLFPQSIAKLVKVDDISWEETEDEERKKWHEEKMKSKVQRPARQLEMLNLSGTVIHC